MRVEPSTEDWAVARRVFQTFARRPGSGHIASEMALAHIAAVMRIKKVRSVLEFGAGIGTVTYLVLDRLAEDGTLVSTEHVPFCLDRLAQNIPAEMMLREGFDIRHPSEISGWETFDLVIADGKVANIPRRTYLQPGSICFIGGARARTRANIVKALAERSLICDFEYHSLRAKRFDWRRTSSGVRYPRINLSLTPTRGCWIGEVSQLS